MGIILACCIFLQTGEKVSPFLSTSLNRSFGCLSPLAVKLERLPFEPCSYTLSWKRDLLYFFSHIFFQKCGTFGRLSVYENPESYADSMHVLCFHAINRPLESYLCTVYCTLSSLYFPVLYSAQEISANWSFSVLCCYAQIT